MAVIDATKHELIDTIKLTGGQLVRPMGVVAAPDGKHIFVTTGRGKNVVIIETATNKPIASIEVGERPWGIAVSADGNTVFTANGPSNDVSIVDVASRTVKAEGHGRRSAVGRCVRSVKVKASGGPKPFDKLPGTSCAFRRSRVMSRVWTALLAIFFCFVLAAGASAQKRGGDPKARGREEPGAVDPGRQSRQDARSTT